MKLGLDVLRGVERDEMHPWLELAFHEPPLLCGRGHQDLRAASAMCGSQIADA